MYHLRTEDLVRAEKLVAIANDAELTGASSPPPGACGTAP